MTVLRWQEASLESSKGFFRGSRLALKAPRHPYPEIMKIHLILWKSIKSYANWWTRMQIHEILRNPMKVLRWREASLESSKGFNRGSCWPLRPSSFISRNPWKSMEINNNQLYVWKSMKIDTILCKSKKYDESPQMTRSQPGIEQRFF